MDQTYISCVAGRFFPEPLGKPQDQEEDDPVQTITRRKGISQELITDLSFEVQVDIFKLRNLVARKILTAEEMILISLFYMSKR